MDIKYNKTNKKLIVGLCLTLLVALPVVIGFFWMPYDLNEVNYTEKFLAPCLAHPFGTDNFGRDIYCRIMRGAGVTFGISIFTVIAGAVIGTVVGALTGYFGGIFDEILMRVNDCLASFPSILLALVVVSLLDKGTLNICIALSLVFIPSFARIMRSEFIAERNKDYVQNARLMGAGHLRVIFVHILPNTFPILFSTMLVCLNNAVLAEAGLSFLGLGVQPPDPSLGRMLSEAQANLIRAPWYEIFTCMVMIVLILGITTISENVKVSGINYRKVRKQILLKRRETKSSDLKTAAKETSPDGREADSPPAENTKDNMNDMPLLKVDNLSISFIDEDALCETVKGISFRLNKGEILGVVGESGSGKSLSALGILGLLPDNAAITGGHVYLEGKDISFFSDDDYRKIRGRDISFVFQEPMTSLNPVVTVGAQIDEVLDIHFSEIPENEQKKLVLEAFEDVGLNNVNELYDMYPHELSGGMRQRVMIVMALVAKSKIIIADEPTTALDADVAGVILDLFEKINSKYGTSIILISHDLRVIGRVSDRTIIMQNGEIVERLAINKDRREIYSMMVTDEKKNGDKSGKVSGTNGYSRPKKFGKMNGTGKSPSAKRRRKQKKIDFSDIYENSKVSSETERTVKIITAECFEEPKTEYGKKLLNAAFAENKLIGPGRTKEAIVKLENVNVYYKSREKNSKGRKQVIFDASLEIRKGDVAGIVGESGCGKTTLVKAIAGLQKYVDGKVELFCEKPGMVFQDPYSSLNPAFTVERILEEPLRIANKKIKGHNAGDKEKLSREEMKKQVAEILKSIELDESISYRKISQLSGGQRQRIAIALTIILRHELIILDEPVSALDVTIQEQILDLLIKLKSKYSLTYIIISHDKRLVSRICNVVYSVEEGRVKQSW